LLGVVGLLAGVVLGVPAMAGAVSAPSWGVSAPATFGTDIQNTSPDARFNSVSCVSAGNCTAAGGFTDFVGNYQAFTQTSAGGVWATAVPATFGTDIQNTSPDAYFRSVSCVSAGNCTAAGGFTDFVGRYQAFTQSSTGGELPPTGLSFPIWPAITLLITGGVLILATATRRHARPTAH